MEAQKKQNRSFWQLFNLSFGFFGVQIAYALQSANISRIFATLGADPHQLSFFWILPPLMGMIVQPLIGKYSDRTWCKLGRRKPYLLVGAIIAVAVMCLLPLAGSFSFGQSLFLGLNAAMWFGLFSLMFLDTSINIAMQPFKMMVGDMVNEEQKGLAYSIQSFLCNAGSLVGYLFPIFFTWIGIANTAPKGVVPNSVIWSFFVGAAILILCVFYTFLTVKELNPQEYAEFHGIDLKAKAKEAVKVVKVKHTAAELSLPFRIFLWITLICAVFVFCYHLGTINTAKQKDVAAAEKIMADNAEAFRYAEVAELDSILKVATTKYTGVAYSESTCPELYKSLAFVDSVVVGTITDMQFVNGTYTMARVLECGQMRADSIQVYMCSTDSLQFAAKLADYQAGNYGEKAKAAWIEESALYDKHIPVEAIEAIFSAEKGSIQTYTNDSTNTAYIISIIDKTEPVAKTKIAILDAKVGSSNLMIVIALLLTTLLLIIGAFQMLCSTKLGSAAMWLSIGFLVLAVYAGMASQYWAFGLPILFLIMFFTSHKENMAWKVIFEEGSVVDLLVRAPKTFWTVGLVQFFCWAAFMYMWTYSNGAIAAQCWGATDTASDGYQAAGNWVGLVFAIQAIGSMLWAMVIPLFKNHKIAYCVSLLLGAAGFISTMFITNQYVLFASYLFIGCAWSAMLALPFTILTNSLSGDNIGSYLGLFNCTICLPQIVAAVLGGVILKHICGGHQVMMLVVAGVLLVLGAVSVFFIKEKKE